MIGYNIRIFLDDKELTTVCYLISTLGKNLSLAKKFQRHNREMTQVKFALQNKQN